MNKQEIDFVLSQKSMYRVFNKTTSKYISGGRSKSSWQRLPAVLDFVSDRVYRCHWYKIEELEIHVFPVVEHTAVSISEAAQYLINKKQKEDEVRESNENKRKLRTLIETLDRKNKEINDIQAAINALTTNDLNFKLTGRK